ncbi:MAG: hypothetical protein AAGF44_04740 [Pseudomonadota bacterium]
MIVAFSFLGFGALGWLRAKRRGGSMADALQYALAHGTAGALAAFVLVIVAGHLGLFAAMG